jgi:hypothetical protein
MKTWRDVLRFTFAPVRIECHVVMGVDSAVDFHRCEVPIRQIVPAENGIFEEPFISKNDHFAKTGSGQT